MVLIDGARQVGKTYTIKEFARDFYRNTVYANFELAWKTMKDYLEQEGFDVKSPRRAIQIAFKTGLIADGHAWIDALEKRNLMAHTYNEDVAREAEELIRDKYYEIIRELCVKLGELV